MGMQWANFMVLKQPLPILRPLKDFDPKALQPYEQLSSNKLSPDIVAEMGTDEYINWTVKDPMSKQDGFVGLSVTYYTGVQDQVPHVPEECYVQGAFSPAGDDKLELQFDRLGQTVPVRRLSFFPPREFVKKSYVYYTICVNGSFYSDRQKVRIALKNPFDTHLYYSKVEISFSNVSESDLSVLDEKACELLDKITLELVDSHWPEKGSERGGSEDQD